MTQLRSVSHGSTALSLNELHVADADNAATETVPVIGTPADAAPEQQEVHAPLSFVTAMTALCDSGIMRNASFAMSTVYCTAHDLPGQQYTSLAML